MNFNDLTVGTIVLFITSIGIISGFFGKFFSQIYKIKQLGEKQEKLEKRMDNFENLQKEQKTELLQKVEATNTAVNLLCSAISAMIDNQLNDNNSLEQLRDIKRKLDDKKEIV